MHEPIHFYYFVTNIYFFNNNFKIIEFFGWILIEIIIGQQEIHKVESILNLDSELLKRESWQSYSKEYFNLIQTCLLSVKEKNQIFFINY